MAIYFIGKTQRDIENISVFSGSETVYGINENENYAMYSLLDEQKELDSKKINEAYLNLRYGMEKFKFMDKEAVFVFNDKELMTKVLQKSTPEMIATKKDTKLVENLSEFNK